MYFQKEEIKREGMSSFIPLPSRINPATFKLRHSVSLHFQLVVILSALFFFFLTDLVLITI